MKGSSKPEIYFLLSKGLKPKQIEELGYKKTTVYYYSRRWKRGKEELIRQGIIDLDGRIKIRQEFNTT